MVGIYCSIKGCWAPGGGKDSKYRFPNPKQNLELFNKWVTICNKNSLKFMTQSEIYSKCRVCRKHFSDDDFHGDKLKKLYAYPHLNIPEESLLQKDNATLSGHTETSSMKITEENSILRPSTSMDHQEVGAQTEPSTSGRSSGLLKEVNIKRAIELTPKAGHLYKRATYFMKRARELKISKLSLRKRLMHATEFTQSEAFHKVVSSMDRVRTRFFKMQVENAPRKPHGQRYTTEDKVLALALYKQCGSGYRLLSKIFSLPSKKTLLRMLNRIPIQPGLCEELFTVLKVEVKTFRNPLSKFCTLIFDEMSIKPSLNKNSINGSVDGFENNGYRQTSSIADHVQVFMLRGIEKNWKQPVFYNFVQGATKKHDIAKIVKMIIRKCQEIGIRVVATICDQGGNNVAAINYLIQDTKRKCILENLIYDGGFFIIGEEKVVPLYDPPHLIKGLGNNFLKYDVVFKMNNQEYVVKWEYIQRAYKIDCYLDTLRTMPKLTEQHVCPNQINKMKVSLCTQVLSRSVATAINLIALSETVVQTETGPVRMDRSAIETAKFIAFLDNLFDSVNGCTNKFNYIKPLKGPVNDNSQHFNLWTESIDTLRSIKFIRNNLSFQPPSVKNFINTIKNFKFLYNMLKEEGFKYILPRKFNQDPLEIFFGQIRQRGIRLNNPTCSLFTPFYKSLLIKGFTSHHSIGANCEEDNSEIFVTLQRFVAQGLHEDDDLEELKISYPKYYPNLNITEGKILKYIGGYLLRIVNKNRKLEGCHCKHVILEKNEEEAKLSDQFTKLKQFKNCRLTYISNYFFMLIVKALHIIKYLLHHHLEKPRIFRHIYDILMNEIEFTQCTHNNILKKIIFTKFINTIGNHFLKQCNRILSGKENRPIPKDAPLILRNCREKFIKSRKR